MRSILRAFSTLALTAMTMTKGALSGCSSESPSNDPSSGAAGSSTSNTVTGASSTVASSTSASSTSASSTSAGAAGAGSRGAGSAGTSSTSGSTGGSSGGGGGNGLGGAEPKDANMPAADSGPTSAECRSYCDCYQTKCSGFVAIPAGQTCAGFCATFTADQQECRSIMCFNSDGPKVNNNNHCQHMVGIDECL
jgi:hypothetical protein